VIHQQKGIGDFGGIGVNPCFILKIFLYTQKTFFGPSAGDLKDLGLARGGLSCWT